MWQWGDGSAVDLADTACEVAGPILKVCSLVLEKGSLSAQDAMCPTRTRGRKEEEVSPLRHFATLLAMQYLPDGL